MYDCYKYSICYERKYKWEVLHNSCLENQLTQIQPAISNYYEIVIIMKISAFALDTLKKFSMLSDMNHKGRHRDGTLKAYDSQICSSR